jgi:butyryl-CoA dehydrogenase
MMALADQQEIMAALADIVTETYAMDSCVLRARKLVASRGEAAAAPAVEMTQVYAAGAMERIESAAKKVITGVAEGDMLRTQLAILRRLGKHEPVNAIVLRQQIAKRVLEAGKYVV